MKCLIGHRISTPLDLVQMSCYRADSFCSDGHDFSGPWLSARGPGFGSSRIAALPFHLKQFFFADFA